MAAQGEIVQEAPSGGWYVRPTLVAGVPDLHALAQEEIFGPVATILTYDTLDQQWIDLSSGRIDAAFADATADQDFLNKPEGADFTMAEASIPSAYDATLGEGIGVGMAQSNTELKAQIDTALCELIADGSISKASEKWFKIDLSRPCQ